MSDIDTVVMDSLKALDPNRPIREADIANSTCFRAAPFLSASYRMPCPEPRGEAMKRREFITLLCSAASALATRRARAAGRADAARGHPPVRNCGRYGISDPVGVFLQELQKLGWSLGHNVRIETRWARPMPAKSADTRRNWPRSPRTSSWPWRLVRRAAATGDPHRADRLPDCRRSGRRRVRR